RARLFPLLSLPAKVYGGQSGKYGLRKGRARLPVQHRQHGGNRPRAGPGRGRGDQMALRAGEAHRTRAQPAQHRRIHRPRGGNGGAQARADWRRRKMKRFLSLVLLGAVLVSLAACGKEEEAPLYSEIPYPTVTITMAD